ncbi:MAG: hypothetical protein COT71_02215 [Candidatus Andersenbacteria bacterium CG10_big_fil_rev_8_21_14_0_10_54_11]|uniref:Antitoxin n=1 Tax=Candidatus Andersenbacteria bacterium CG10_big_fil_rev_8_21_14_0_10_54_11 TaxID=1974485 RepID=A0A2M6WZG8_9BACT|nr:MAG: hypothetical protein COT71_02215 [Candidatus Andersenbacteria bacterium CG10_big_fil_rev_8_21_14_0_10_54_11]
MDIRRSVVVDPDVAHGKPVFRGTRVMVWQVLEMLEAGQSKDDIYQAYPNLPEGAVEDALHYAADRTRHVSYAPFSKRQKQDPVSP